MSFVSAADADKNSYDVIVVGSGAAGGQTAYTLAMDGAKVLMLEAGRDYQPATETPMFQVNGQAPLRGAGTPEKPFGFWDATIDGGWQVPGEPYTSASDDPARQFVWWRARMLGGRTNHWGRISLRNGPYDFKPYTRDGLGFDWPMNYEDLAPYYDKVEMLIGVYGANDGLENTPNSSPGVLLPPPKPRVSDLLIQHRSKKLGIPVVAGHRAVLTQALDHKRLPKLLHPGNAKAQQILAADMQKRAACFFATPCGRGCSIRANYQSTTVHLPPALDTGNLDIVTDAMVRTVNKRVDGKAEGVTYIDRKTGAEHRVKARVVVLAASALESVRILLNSDVANSSGKVGKYIMDTVGANFGGQVPLLENMPLHNEDGVDGLHLYTPWWLYKEQLAGKLGFARGYHFEFGGGRGMPGMGTASGLDWLNGGTYGKKFKEDARRYFGSFVGFAGRGEMIPNDDCYAELDPNVKDRFGIPVLRFHWKWSQHELGQAAHMQKTAAEIIDAMGGRYATPPQTGEKAIKQGGIIIHEVGGAMMGNDPRKSVTNSFGQCWDMKNLFLTDGATLCSNADKNPTLTIMALAWRSADHMLGLMKRKEL
ncbi:MAG TPA: GMC family oxidoreductase [Steroidobacteraceae bacterium]|nr:GMC family oxidoreductase [Steroidobacteraceae bacterium]